MGEGVSAEDRSTLVDAALCVLLVRGSVGLGVLGGTGLGVGTGIGVHVREETGTGDQVPGQLGAVVITEWWCLRPVLSWWTCVWW